MINLQPTTRREEYQGMLDNIQDWKSLPRSKFPYWDNKWINMTTTLILEDGWMRFLC